MVGGSRAAKKRAKKKGLPPPAAQPAVPRSKAPRVEQVLPKRRERDLAATLPAPPRKKKKSRNSGSFQVVPAGYTAQTHGGSGSGGKSSQNTLRQAQMGALGSKGSAAARKADEIWFRKCGHGEMLFESYYRGQGEGIIPADDWPAFRAALRRPLPLTFRVHGVASAGRAALLEQLSQLEELGSVAPVSWAPRELGIWQSVGGLDKRAAAAAERGGSELAALLRDGVGGGLLNRQEVVSMLPVLALRVPPGASCLDMCASPGSKTMQLLEAVAAADADAAGADARAAGLVMANDAHPKRVKALQAALARHGRPAGELARLVVACHRGEELPAPARPFGGAGGDGGARGAGAAGGGAGFDRVLADVPCSGDGTIRKDPSVLPRWTPAVSNQLHAVQLEIAWRGLQLLRVGGLMCYSTCSLNPVEDEAVVAALLLRAEAETPGAVRLEAWPAAHVLPALVRRPGVGAWRVAEHVESGAHGDGGADDADDADGADGADDGTSATAGDGGGGAELRLRWPASYERAKAVGMPHAVPTLWPPPAAVAASLHLERCSRLLHHDQDTGGFFVALLRKKRPLAPGGGGGGGGGGTARPATGPASSRELPELEAEDVMAPLAAREGRALAARLGLPAEAAERRLLRTTGGAHAPVCLAPQALAAFAAGELRVAGAGVAITDFPPARREAAGQQSGLAKPN